MSGTKDAGLAGKSTTGANSRRLGVGLILVGILGILWGVFHILNAVDPPGRMTFENRVPYNEAKRIVHAHFFGGMLRSLAGLCVCLLGGRLLRTAKSAETQ